MNRSAKDGARSSPHYGGEGVTHSPIEPRCLLTATGTVDGLCAKRHQIVGEIRLYRAISDGRSRQGSELAREPTVTR